MIIAVHYSYPAELLPIRDEHRPAHRDWLRSGVERGEVLTGGSYADGSGGLILITADSPEAAAAYMADDPFQVNGGVGAAQYKQWRPSVGALRE